mgnify:CR=1 FL=1
MKDKAFHTEDYQSDPDCSKTDCLRKAESLSIYQDAQQKLKRRRDVLHDADGRKRCSLSGGGKQEKRNGRNKAGPGHPQVRFESMVKKGTPANPVLISKKEEARDEKDSRLQSQAGCRFQWSKLFRQSIKAKCDSKAEGDPWKTAIDQREIDHAHGR